MKSNLIIKTKKAVIFVTGITVLGFGISLIVLPGPAIIVIPVGLAILGSEFLWARQALKKIKNKVGLR
jgi:hypothetical protein